MLVNEEAAELSWYFLQGFLKTFYCIKVEERKTKVTLNAVPFILFSSAFHLI